MNEANVIGVMSGTSLDGLDIVLCRFCKTGGQWMYNILRSKTIDYPAAMEKQLLHAHQLQGDALTMLDKAYGAFIGNSINNFLKDCSEQVHLIGSHGHTVFHDPAQKLNLQVGDGNMIAAITGITTVYDFRSLDIALNGQGAPLVPAGDELLFGEFDYCINLGGFANISFKQDNKRVAFDICPVNTVINKYSRLLGYPFDEDGHLAGKGNINQHILEKLNAIAYYQKLPPKSLSREWLENTFFTLLDAESFTPEDILRTVYEHIAMQVKVALDNEAIGDKVLVTGGGAFNDFLMELIREKTSKNIIIPEDKLVEHKEAIIFAFLGLLRYNKEVNCLASVTGAERDSCSGVVVCGEGGNNAE